MKQIRMRMHRGHKEFIAFFEANRGDGNREQINDSYSGSKHPFYVVSVPKRRAMLKNWLKKNKECNAKDIVELVDSLMRGESHEEKTTASYLLGYRKDARALVSVTQIDTWLDDLVGWAEVDALCQNIFTVEELLKDWSVWERFLIQLSKDKNINKRRASLVFLTGVTSRSGDERLHTLAYENIGRLKGESDILITKAISWLLRSMADTRKSDVTKYLKNESETLPKIAVRETLRKLETGKKNK